MTPGCSTCGYVVEWLRSCYESEWRLFQDRPDVKTPGRYVFSPPGTPCYPSWHNLGSSIWTTDERDPEPMLGEVDGTHRLYSLGVAPLPFAPAALLGSSACIEQGERYPLPIIDRTFPGNWDSRCFTIPPPPLPPGIPTPDIFLCETQRSYIQAIGQLSAGNTAGAVAILQAALPGWTITAVDDGDGPLPGSLIAIRGNSTVILVAGTSNLTQWTYQITGGVLGITDYGWYSTLAFWRTASDAILDRLETAGMDSSGPLCFVGHSFGAALCCILAARMLMFNTGRPVQLLTFGCPKPGDDRLIALLRPSRQLHFVNSDDPIPYLPPGINEIAIVAALVPDSLIARWSSWRPPENRFGLTPEALRYDNPSSVGLVGIIYRTVVRLLAGLEPPAATAHGTPEYERRVACPDDPPPGKIPVDPFRNVIGWLRPEYLDSAYVLGDEIVEWGDDGPFGFDGKEGPFGNVMHVADDGAIVGTVAEVKKNGAMQIPGLELGNAHSLYVMTTFKRPVDAAALSIRWFGVGGFVMDLNPGFARFTYSCLNTNVNGIFGTASGLRLFSVRREATSVELMVDGAVLASGSADPAGTIKVNGFQALGPAAGPTTRMWIAEAIFFGHSIDDDQHGEVMAYFTSRYGVP